MTECLEQGGRPRQEGVGWSGGKGGGVETWLVLYRHISPLFQTGKSCAHLQRVTVFTTLPGSTDFFLSCSQTLLVFFIARAQQTWGLSPHPPPCIKKTHTTSNSQNPAHMGSRCGWVEGSMLQLRAHVQTNRVSSVQVFNDTPRVPSTHCF